jgi:hypothetical protein
MNNLRELKDLFIKHEKKVKDDEGWSFKVGKDTYTMLAGYVYRNQIQMTDKEVNTMFKKKGK